MRKGILVIVVMVIAALLNSYYAVGKKAESQFHHLVALANKSPNVKIVTESYQRHWFTSNVVLDITLHKPAEEEVIDGKMQTSPAKDVNFKANVDVFHGPIIISRDKVTLGWGYARAQVPVPAQALMQFDSLFSADSTKPSLWASLLLKYDSSSEMTLNAPSFKLSQKKGVGQLSWEGVTSDWYVSSDMRHVKGKLSFAGMTFKNENSDGSIGSINVDYNIAEDINGVWLGNAEINFPALEFNVAGQKKLALSGFDIKSESDVHSSNLLDSTLTASLDKLVIDGVNYGPGRFELILRNLDAKILGEIQAQLKSTDSTHFTSDQRQMLLISLLPKLSQLVAQGAEIEIQTLNFVMPQGDIKITAKVSLPKGSSITNPIMMFAAIKANANLQIPVALVQQTLSHVMQGKIKQTQLMQQLIQKQMQQTNQQPATKSTNGQTAVLTDDEITKMANEQTQQQLQHWITAGILAQNGNLYTVDLNFQAGQLTVNGKPFDSGLLK